MQRYEIIPHTADTGIIAYGATLHELFEHAAFGMFDLVADLDSIPSRHSRPIIAPGDTVEELLVNWLSNLLAESEIRGILFSAFAVDRLEEGGLQGSAQGMPFDQVELHGPPIKAVTWHELAVVEIPDGWWARVIFDV